MLKRKPQVPDVMTATNPETNSLQLRYGTSAWRLQQELDDQPMDQESTSFYAGDIRDCLSTCDPKAFKSLRDLIRNKKVSEMVTAPIAEMKSLVGAVLRPGSGSV